MGVVVGWFFLDRIFVVILLVCIFNVCWLIFIVVKLFCFIIVFIEGIIGVLVWFVFLIIVCMVLVIVLLVGI